MANQTISIAIKQPPNPEPVRILGIFALPMDISTLTTFLSGIASLPQDAIFKQNVKDEIIKSVQLSEVKTVMQAGKTLTITLELPCESTDT